MKEKEATRASSAAKKAMEKKQKQGGREKRLEGKVGIYTKWMDK